MLLRISKHFHFFFKCNNIAMAVDRMKFCDSKCSEFNALLFCWRERKGEGI